MQNNFEDYKTIPNRLEFLDRIESEFGGNKRIAIMKQ